MKEKIASSSMYPSTNGLLNAGMRRCLKPNTAIIPQKIKPKIDFTNR